MKKAVWLVLVVPLFLSGCGDIEWFPSNNGVFANNSSNKNNGATAQTSKPSLIMSFSPANVSTDTNSTLTFSIINGAGSPAQSGLGFTDTLPAGLTVATPTTPQCGGTVSVSASVLTFSGGSLAAGPTSCTITAAASGAAGSFVNKATDISGLTGGLQNGVTDQTLTVFATIPPGT